MFFLDTGCAFAKSKDKLGQEKFLGKLDDGDHFGDIALFYETRRSATVISGDFSTLAMLTRENYKEVVKLIPEFHNMIEKCIQTYNDDHKKHILTMLRRIEFLREGISPLILNQLVYTIHSEAKDAGSLIFKPGDPMNSIQLIEEGLVEIYIYFEDTKFVLERLYTGSVINYRNLFLDDEPTQVYA